MTQESPVLGPGLITLNGGSTAVLHWHLVHLSVGRARMPFATGGQQGGHKDHQRKYDVQLLHRSFVYSPERRVVRSSSVKINRGYVRALQNVSTSGSSIFRAMKEDTQSDNAPSTPDIGDGWSQCLRGVLHTPTFKDFKVFLVGEC